MLLGTRMVDWHCRGTPFVKVNHFCSLELSGECSLALGQPDSKIQLSPGREWRGVPKSES